jgi:hypothetical protein
MIQDALPEWVDPNVLRVAALLVLVLYIYFGFFAKTVSQESTVEPASKDSKKNE